MRKKYNTPHRCHVIKTRLSDEEHADFMERLAAYQISQSEFIRQAIQGATIRPVITVSPVNDELLSAVGKLTAEYGRIGGNVVENSMAPCDVIADIRKAVGPDLKVFADGGVRSGEDVFKMLALGADAVGIGRPYVVSVYGGAQDGANIYTQKIYYELQNIMRLTDCRTLADITADKLILLNKKH